MGAETRLMLGVSLTKQGEKHAKTDETCHGHGKWGQTHVKKTSEIGGKNDGQTRPSTRLFFKRRDQAKVSERGEKH